MSTLFHCRTRSCGRWGWRVLDASVPEPRRRSPLSGCLPPCPVCAECTTSETCRLRTYPRRCACVTTPSSPRAVQKPPTARASRTTGGRWTSCVQPSLPATADTSATPAGTWALPSLGLQHQVRLTRKNYVYFLRNSSIKRIGYNCNSFFFVL